MLVKGFTECGVYKAGVTTAALQAFPVVRAVKKNSHRGR